MNIECEFSSVQNLGTEIKPDYEFSAFDCDLSSIYEFVENPTTTSSFYLEKTFSYGDFFVMFFLTAFAVVKIVEIIWTNFFKK